MARQDSLVLNREIQSRRPVPLSVDEVNVDHITRTASDNIDRVGGLTHRDSFFTQN